MQPTPHSTQKKRAGCLAQVGRIMLGLLVALLVLVAAGSIYESFARAKEIGLVSAPGQFVDVGGYRLHILCMGQKTPGQPTVILESGAGGWSIHWYTFQRQAAQFARVCAYDRAGYGWSEAGPQPRDGKRIAEALHTLLVNSGESGPSLLVGASRGGKYIRLFRDAYPADVVGLVLVDAEPEDFRSQALLGKNLAAQNEAMFSAVGALTRIGFFRLMGGDPASAPEVPCIPFMVKTLPVEEHAAYQAVEGQPKCFEALLGEEAATDQREAQVREVQPLGDLPLIVLSHGIPSAAPGGVPPEQAAQTEQVWQDLQKELASLSTNGTLIQATKSGHNIALDQPELVLDAFRLIMK